MSRLNATSLWLQQLDKLVSSPEILIREQEVREIIADSVTIEMNEPFVYDNLRNVSNAFRFAEAYWILSGDNRVSTISEYAPSIEHFSDNGHVFQGAYGPKVTEQLRYVCDSLNKDLNTRQAVMSIWRENPRDSKDIPCTLSLQFLARSGALHCVATMRSSDVWLGLPYDLFNFSCIANWVRLKVNSDWENLNDLKLGRLTVNMGSSHLYKRNYEKAACICKFSDDGWYPGQLIDFPKFRKPEELMQWLFVERIRAKSAKELSHEG